MLTIDALKAYGADTAQGMARCMNNETFYLRLVHMELMDENFDRLASALSAGDAKAGFEAAHALKGAVGNLALTPIYDPVCALTEKLRGAGDMPDTGDLLPAIQDALARLRALAEE